MTDTKRIEGLELTISKMKAQNLRLISENRQLKCEPKQEWIPVTERLPEDMKPVFVTWKNADPKSYYQYIVGKHFIGVAYYLRGKWYWYSSTTEDFLAECGKHEGEEFDEAIKVIAWVPLPTCYKSPERLGERMKDYSALDELIPKTRELHRAIFDKGYEQAKKDILEEKPKTCWHMALGKFICSCGYIKVMDDTDMIEWRYCPVCGGGMEVDNERI